MGRQKKRGRKRYWEQVRELADEHGWSVSEARQQWSRFYKKGGKKRKKPKAEFVDPIVLLDAAPTEGPTCPYCRIGFHDHEETSVCSGCQTRLHAECRAELRRCPTIGCAGGLQTTRLRVEPVGPITITPENLPARWRRWVRPERVAVVALGALLVSMVAALVIKLVLELT